MPGLLGEDAALSPERKEQISAGDVLSGVESLKASFGDVGSSSEEVGLSSDVSLEVQSLNLAGGDDEVPRSSCSSRETEACGDSQLVQNGTELKTEASIENGLSQSELKDPIENGSGPSQLHVPIHNESIETDLESQIERSSQNTAAADSFTENASQINFPIYSEREQENREGHALEEDSSGSTMASVQESLQASKEERIQEEIEHAHSSHKVEVSNAAGISGRSAAPMRKQRVKNKQDVVLPAGGKRSPPPVLNRRCSVEENMHQSAQKEHKVDQRSPKDEKTSGRTSTDDDGKCNHAGEKLKTKEMRFRKPSVNPQQRILHASSARVFPGSPSPRKTTAEALVEALPRSPTAGSGLRPLDISSVSNENLPNAPLKVLPSKLSPQFHMPAISTPKSVVSNGTPRKKLAKRKISRGSSRKDRVQQRVKELLSRKTDGDSLEGTKATRLLSGCESQHGSDDEELAGLGSPDLGPFLLKLAKTAISSGDDPYKALDFATKAATSFQRSCNGKPSLDLVRSLHIIAAIYCCVGQFEEAIPVLEYAIGVPDIEGGGLDHALAAFAGHMQLGDAFALLGRSESALAAYHAGLEVQKLALGCMDPRVGETCRYLAEAHAQALQFSKAEEFCQHALDIHKECSPAASLEESTDRRLMGLILNSKGEYEAALEHLVLASMALISNGLDVEVASVDTSIGDTYVSLGRYDEAVFAYQKALTVFKSAKGENHTSVASVYVSLAELYLKTGKVRESKTYCESALRIFSMKGAGHQLDELASGLTEAAAVYEALNEQEQALALLQKALGLLEAAPGQQSAAAGVQAQIGVLCYTSGEFTEALTAFQNCLSILRESAEKNSSLLGVVLNQLGLASVQLGKVEEAVEKFEEARSILEKSLGPYHVDTLAVYSNLAGAYDALGRLDDAIRVLEYVLEVREEKIGTANSDADDERRRLAELLKEAGRLRSQRPNGTLQQLMRSNTQQVPRDGRNSVSANGHGI
eukprot:c29062_g1_i1 orf=500-3460(+)